MVHRKEVLHARLADRVKKKKFFFGGGCKPIKTAHAGKRTSPCYCCIRMLEIAYTSSLLHRLHGYFMPAQPCLDFVACTSLRSSLCQRHNKGCPCCLPVGAYQSVVKCCVGIGCLKNSSRKGRRPQANKPIDFGKRKNGRTQHFCADRFKRHANRGGRANAWLVS